MIIGSHILGVQPYCHFLSAFKYPSEEKQREFLHELYKNGGDLEADDVEYVECNATGDLMADAQEVNALTTGLETGTGSALLIGSVKSNIGHLGAAAGNSLEIKQNVS